MSASAGSSDGRHQRRMAGALGAFGRETFRSCRIRNCRLWFLGQGISMTGFWVQIVGQGILVLRLTDSGSMLGVVTAVQFLPIVVVGPWAGVLSDRIDKRRLMVVTQASMMTCGLVLGVLVLTGHVTFPAVLVLAGLTGTAWAYDQPARRTFVTELVPDADAANAVSLNGSLNEATKIVGPAIAGVIIATIGLGWCFVVNGLAWVAVIATLLLMDGDAIRAPERSAPRDGLISEGFHYVWDEPSVRLILLMLGIVAVFAFNWTVLLPLLAVRDFDASASTYALLMACMSVGSVTSTLWLARRPAPDARFLGRICLLFGAASGALALAPTVLAACVVVVGVGATSTVLFTGGGAALQLGAEPAMRGRVMAVFSMVFLGGHAIGGSLSGVVAQVFGARISLGMGGVAGLLAGGLVLARPRDQIGGLRAPDPPVSAMPAGNVRPVPVITTTATPGSVAAASSAIAPPSHL